MPAPTLKAMGLFVLHVQVRVEHLLHFMLADGADSLLNDATALE
jgi:hypothetical protein